MHLLVAGPAPTRNVFLASEDKKQLEIPEAHSCLWPGAELFFRHNWINLATASLLLHCILLYSCLGYWTENVSCVFQVSIWIFLVIRCHGNVWNWNPNVIWPRLVFLGVFCWNMLRFVNFKSAWTEMCKNCSIVILFWRNQFFSIVWRVFWSVLWTCLCLLAKGFRNIDW